MFPAVRAARQGTATLSRLRRLPTGGDCAAGRAAPISNSARALVVGGGAGFAGSLVGLGGGFVAIPALTGWLRLTQHQAHATSLAAVMAAGAAGSFGYWWAGQVDFAAAGSMAVGGMAGAAVGARIATRLSAVALKRALGVLMMSVAPMVPLREALLASVAGGGADGGGGGGGAATASDASNADAATHGGGRAGKSGDAAGAASSPLLPAAISGAGDGESEPRLSSTSQVDSSVDQPAGAPAAAFSSLSPVRMVFIGLGSGLLAGVFGVGGGVINIPAVALATDLSHLQCLGTSLAAMVLPAVTGAVAHRRTGSFLPAVALPLAAGTAAGAFAGSRLATEKLPEEFLKWTFAALMAVMGALTFRAAGVAARAARAPVAAPPGAVAAPAAARKAPQR